MVKLEEERRWGAMLGVMQDDIARMRSTLRTIVSTLNMDIMTIDSRMRGDGLNPRDDEHYVRCCRLSSLLGGLYNILDGYDGVMSATIMELINEEK